MSFIVATNIVASRLPKRRPTGIPTARANILTFLDNFWSQISAQEDFLMKDYLWSKELYQKY